MKTTNNSRIQTSRKMRNRKKISCLLLFVCSLLFSCSENALYFQYQVIQDTAWEKSKVYYFTFFVEDTTTAYTVLLDIRNNNRYPYQNLWLFSNEEPPIGPLVRDTIECLLADEFGKWYGHGISLYESTFPIRENYRFPCPGQYTFSFRQGMRDSILPGIQEIGICIMPFVEKTENGNR